MAYVSVFIPSNSFKCSNPSRYYCIFIYRNMLIINYYYGELYYFNVFQRYHIILNYII